MKANLIKSYESGIKDVISINVNKQNLEFINKMKRKKCYRQFVRLNTPVGISHLYVFFRKREDKEYFMKNIKHHLEDFTMENVAIEYGLLLGFPPKACLLFSEKTYNKSYLPVTNIKFDYNGMVFASYPESLEEDFLWLLENKPLKEGDYISIGSKKYSAGRELKEEVLRDMKKCIFFNQD